MNALLTEILQNPWPSLLMIFNIILLEVLLSVDNASAIAIMVMDLPEKQRNRALRYGIIGAYVFRGLALLFASYIISIWWIKPIGGIYLIWLTYKYFKNKADKDSNESEESKKKNIGWLHKLLGTFWATVVMVEILDLSLSIDNVLAVVAFSDNYIIICFGVFIGILAMRYVAQMFVKLMEKFPFLETSAFVVIGILGLKLLSSIGSHYYESMKFLDGEAMDWIMSALTISVFVLPIAYVKMFPKNKAA